MSTPSLYRLRAYRFPPGADFAGHLAGALERMLLVGGLCDALFVMRDARSGEPVAIDLHTASAGGTVAAMLDFRLDERRRRAVTDAALAPGAGRIERAVVEDVASALEAGGALLAVLVADRPAGALEDAAARTGGRLVADEVTGADRIADLERGALARVAGGRERNATTIHTPDRR